MMRRTIPLLAAVTLLAMPLATPSSAMAQSPASDRSERPRARDLGMRIGVFQPGDDNAITDVAGVRVGHATVVEGDDVRTGITAIHPVDGNPYFSRPPAAMFVGNGYGKLIGVTQVRELGELETPILLTCTLCVWKAADAMVGWMLDREGMEGVRSLNAVVGETNDGGLNDIRARPITPEDVVAALEGATAGEVEEGSVGAGTGTRAFGWKGGIGTSSRVLPDQYGGYTVGVLVQSNFGGILTMDGAPVGEELGRYSFRGVVEGGDGEVEEVDPNDVDVGDGSIMMVVATDAPLSDRNLERLAARAVMGLARTGSFAGNGSGDYVIAFSTAEEVRRGRDGAEVPSDGLENSDMSPLFQAVVESTEEAIYNSLLRATTVTGVRGNTADALPIDETVEVLERYGVIGR
ncbi:MAG TPA: P1 family peptidase [Longimicrobiales bacterium]|nr:P1 family peptidase [Longimicrobiales bacterium]